MLSDAEIDKRVNRINKENEYNKLFYGEPKSRGVEAAKAVLDAVGTTIGIAGGVLGIMASYKAIKG